MDSQADHLAVDFSLIDKSREKHPRAEGNYSRNEFISSESETLKDRLPPSLKGISLEGFRAIIYYAGGRSKITKGVDLLRNWRYFYLIFASWLYLTIFLGLIGSIISRCPNWRENEVFCGAAGQVLVWFGMLLLVFLFGGFYEKFLHVPPRREDHEPGCDEVWCPWFFPWVYSKPKTTDFIKRSHVLPFTSTRQCAYIDILQKESNADELVGPATVFVSHTYSSLFLDAFDAIEEWEKQNPRADGSPHFYYFDLFINSQHGNPVVPFHELRDTFGMGVQSTKQVLLLITDLDIKQPIALSRSWCIFEIATALEKGIPFDVIMPPVDEERINKAFRYGEYGFDYIKNRLSIIDVEKAEAREAKDQENIHRVIKEDMSGFLAVNQLVISAMRKWITERGVKFLQKSNSDKNYSLSLFIDGQVIKLLQDECRFKEAENVCRDSLQILSSIRSDQVVLDSMKSYAGANPHDYPYHKGIIGSRLKEMGNDAFFNKETIDRTLLLSKMLAYQQKNEEAAAASRDATRLELRAILESCRKVRDEFHPETLSAMHNLADVETTDNISERIDLFKTALQGRRKYFGDIHPETLSTLRNLKKLLEAEGRSDEILLIWPNGKVI